MSDISSTLERIAARGHAHLPAWLDARICRETVARVYAARSEWTSNFEDEQFTVGAAWYTHLEQDDIATYFARRAASNALVERVCGEACGALLEALTAAVGLTCEPRAGFCGPGVHVFPVDKVAAREGGDVHFDTEGLSAAQRVERGPALTAVLMLQPPERGGGLRIWEAPFVEGLEQDEEALAAACESDSVLIEYGEGDLLLLDSFRLHQIQPFGGSRDRISLTCHVARKDAAWEYWF